MTPKFHEAPDESEKIEQNEKEGTDKLPDHFESEYALKPKEAYEVNQYRYETDRYGRISHCEGTLRLEEGTRDPEHQRKAGGKDRLEHDDGGHLIATRFDGSGKIDNIVPMDSHLNRSDYKAMENGWAKALEEGKTVDVAIDCKYEGNSERPKEFRVKYVVSDESGEIERRSKSFKNKEE